MLRAGSLESNLAIVGAGFSGAARLLRSTQVNVAVIEDRPRLGLGLAYRDAQDFQILNCSGGPHEFLGRRTQRSFSIGRSCADTSLDGEKPSWPLWRAAAAGSRMFVAHATIMPPSCDVAAPSGQDVLPRNSA